MAKCSCHRNVGISSWRNRNRRPVSFFHEMRHHVRCDVCDRLLPCGPANDTPRVLVEIRAAELAAAWQPIGGFRGLADSDEIRRGWSMAETNLEEHTTDWHVGYLAREIAMHKETP